MNDRRESPAPVHSREAGWCR